MRVDVTLKLLAALVAFAVGDVGAQMIDPGPDYGAPGVQVPNDIGPGVLLDPVVVTAPLIPNPTWDFQHGSLAFFPDTNVQSNCTDTPVVVATGAKVKTEVECTGVG